MIKDELGKISRIKIMEKIGVTIEFKTYSNIKINSKLSIIINNDIDDKKEHYFEVIEITTQTQKQDQSYFIVVAKEVGYWANKLDRKNNFDIRSLIGLGICLINDKDKIAEINKESGWC